MKFWIGFIAVAGVSSAAFGQLSESFDDVTFPSGVSAANLLGRGWAVKNNSSPQVSSSTTWFGGNPGLFPSHSGNSYVGANYQATSDPAAGGTISDWLITPTLSFKNGDQFKFWTRTVTNVFTPDRLQVYYSTNGSSTNVGTSATSLGDFSNLILDLNPTFTTTGYPNAWTLETITLAGVTGTASGRFAFRYFADQAGQLGSHGDYIGVDDVSFTAVPEPTSMVVLGLGALALIKRRRASK